MSMPSPHLLSVLRRAALPVLACVAFLPLTGCQPMQVAGRAHMAPPLQPVSSSMYTVSLGTREAENNGERNSRLEPIHLPEPKTPRGQ